MSLYNLFTNFVKFLIDNVAFHWLIFLIGPEVSEFV